MKVEDYFKFQWKNQIKNGNKYIYVWIIARKSYNITKN